MEKSKLSFLLDFLFKSILIFFISFIWLRLYIHNNALIIFLSILITLFSSIILSLVLKSKFNKIKLSKKEIKEKQNYLNQLNFSSNKEINDLLIRFYKTEKIIKHKDFFEIEKEENIIVFNNFSFVATNISFIIDCIKKVQSKNINKIIIFASNFENVCYNFVKNLKDKKIKLIDFDNLYTNFMKKHNMFPEIKIKYE